MNDRKSTFRWVPKSSVFLACVPLLFVTLNLVANDGDTLLLITQRRTDLYASIQGAAKKTGELSADTVVVGVRRQDLRSGDGRTLSYWQVRRQNHESAYEFVSASELIPVSSLHAEMRARAISVQTGEADGSTPDLIRIQANADLRQAWKDAQLAVEENEKLPDADRLAEPYFARAAVWSSVGNYSASLQDYLTGIRVARATGRDLISFSEYFDGLNETAEKLSQIPVPSASGPTDTYELRAKRHFGMGTTAYWAGDLNTALMRFDNAVQLAPNQPLFWYFRALSKKQLGDAAGARYDALLGSYFERYLSGSVQRSITGALSRQQGALRSWLERYRLGDINCRLVWEPNEDPLVLD